ncbi:hypothetical protein N9176_00420 [bacterium]|nr:hypothetical protein [bacterium]
MNRTLVSLFGAFIMLFLFQSCCKDEIISPEEFSDLINLQVGNYWVYESGTVAENGNLENSRIDSVVVLNEIFEVGVKLYELSGSLGLDNKESSFVYDSLNYLIEFPSRRILFTTDTAYVDIVDNQLFDGVQKNEPERQMVEVPAGSFNSYNLKSVFDSKDPDYEFGQLQSNIYFADGVSLIKTDGQYASSGTKIEKRLSSYGKK